MKNLYFDLETTGLSPHRNGFFQFAGIIEIDDQIIEEIDFKVKPLGQPDRNTMKFHNLSMDEFDKPEYLDSFSFFNRFKNILSKYIDKYNKGDKFHLIGYNIHSFDIPFLRQLFIYHQDKYFGSWFWHPSIDVMLILAEHFKTERRYLTDFKNATVARYLGIEVDESKLHEAMYDIQLTKQIYLEYLKRTKKSSNQKELHHD